MLIRQDWNRGGAGLLEPQKLDYGSLPGLDEDKYGLVVPEAEILQRDGVEPPNHG